MKLLSYTLSVPVLVATAYAAQYLTVEQAQQAFFPGADAFHQQNLKLSAAQLAQIEDLSHTRMRLNRYRIWEALNAGRRIGTVIVDEVYGKHEFITYALGIDLSGKVVGLEILEYRESYGGQIRNAPWRAQFVGKSANDALELDRDIRNIGGATLSCQHVTEGIRRLLALYHVALAKK